MGELKGSLYICNGSIFEPFRIWVMKKYGIEESWSKVFSVDPLGGDHWPYGLYWPVKHFKKGDAVLIYHSHNCFFYYEPKKYEFKFFKVRGTQSKFEVIPHIPSLIPLKDTVKGDNVEVLNVYSRMGKKIKRNSMISNARQEGNRVADKVDAEIQELGGPSFADLPSAITTHILLRLPMKSVLICRCVCKSWNTLISDPQFAKLHFKHAHVGVLIRTNDPKRVSRTLHLLEYEPEKFSSYYYEEKFCWCHDKLEPECNNHIKLELKFKLPLRDSKLVLNKRNETKNSGGKRSYIACKPRDDKFGVVNSCNGFLCLSDPRNGDPLAVCNPVTGEFIRFPKATTVEKMRIPIYAGFGFHEKTNEYKVIRMFTRYVKHPPHFREWMYDCVVVEMHTVGTSTWRNIGGDIKFVNLLRFPTCVNGAPHWICSDGWKRSILCFNFESDSFQSFPSPPHVFNNNGSQSVENISMGELKGSLYICDASSYDPIRMWVMKKYGIGESWSEVFSIDTMDGLYWPVKHFKKGDAVLMYHSCNCFIYYEPKNIAFQFFKVRGTQSKFEAIPHIPSLIPLTDAVKGDNVEVLNVYSRCAAFKLREENEALFFAEEFVGMASLYSSSDPDGEEYSS